MSASAYAQQPSRGAREEAAAGKTPTRRNRAGGKAPEPAPPVNIKIEVSITVRAGQSTGEEGRMVIVGDRQRQHPQQRERAREGPGVPNNFNYRS